MKHNPLSDVIHKYNQATELLNKGKHKKALSLFKEVIKEYPCKEAYTNIGNCYRALGQDAMMFQSYTKALEPLPYLDVGSKTHLHALNNLGLAHYMYGDDDKAISLYTKAIKEKQDFWEAWWNCSTATLRKASSGSPELFERGWEMYRARFLKESSSVQIKNKRKDLVYWDTISDGEDIVVLAEQGIGDHIMFGRYLPLLAKKFKRVFIQCDPSLDVIFKDYLCIRDPIEIESNDLVGYPICSLAECFGCVPSGDWLKGKYETFEFDLSRLNVGIVWAGSPSHANNAYRSVPINRFHSLSKHANLYSLTPGFKGSKHVNALDIKSWEDTAKYINGLDLVIGVDTSVMHMCGALGAKGLLLQPYKETDFRWGNGVSHSVWYDTIEVISNPQSWETVFATVEEKLCAM